MAKFGQLDVKPGDYVQYRDTAGAGIRARVVGIETERSLGETVWLWPLIKPKSFVASPNVAGLVEMQEVLDSAAGDDARAMCRRVIGFYREYAMGEIDDRVMTSGGRSAPRWVVPCDPAVAEKLGATVSRARVLPQWPWQGIFVGDFVWLDLRQSAAVAELGSEVCFATDALDPRNRRITVTATCLSAGSTYNFSYDDITLRKMIARID